MTLSWELPCARSRPRTETPNLIAAGREFEAGPPRSKREPVGVRCGLARALRHRSAAARSAADAAHGPFSAVPVRGGSAVPGGIQVLRGCAALSADGGSDLPR